MSEITPEKVAAAVAAGDTGWIENLQAALSFSARDNVLGMDVARWDGPQDGEVVRCFRAVVVEGETDPIVLERPEELGLQWDDGADLLALTADGILFNPRGVDEWDLDPAGARELASHLAAMADAAEAAQAEKGGTNG